MESFLEDLYWALQILCQASLFLPLLKIVNFLFGSENKDRRTSHDDKVNELTHEQTEKRQAEKRGGDWEREGE